MDARARLSAIVITLLLVGSAVLIVPTAAATHAFAEASAYLSASGTDENGNPVNVNFTAPGVTIPIVKVDTVLTFTVSARVTACTATPPHTLSFSFTADLTGIGGTSNQPFTTSSPTGTTGLGTLGFTVPAGASSVNGARTIPITWTATCSAAVGGESPATIGPFSLNAPEIPLVDRKLPTFDWTPPSPANPPRKIGSTYSLTFENELDVAKYTISAAGVTDGLTVTPRTTATGGRLPNQTGLTVSATGVDDPTITVTAYDASGNAFSRTTGSGTFDARAPSIGLIRPAAQTISGVRSVLITVPDGKHNDITNYSVWITKNETGGRALRVECLNTTTPATGACWTQTVATPTVEAQLNTNAQYTLFENARLYNISVVAYDEAGNPSSNSTVLDFGWFDLPTVTFTAPAVPFGTAIPTFAGAINDPNGALNISLKNPGGNYWDSATSTYVAAYKAYPICAAPCGATWSFPNTLAPGNTWGTPTTATQGEYVVNVTMATATAAGSFFRNFTIDSQAPNLDLGTSLSNNTLDDSSITKWRQGIDVITVRVGANDSSGIDKIAFSVVYSSNKTVVKGFNGQPLTVTCDTTTIAAPPAGTNGCWLTPALPVGATNYHYENATLRGSAAAPPKANLSFAKAPLGKYELQMSVFDRAGNAVTTPVLTTSATLAQRQNVNITFGPRVVIPAGNATVGADRKITASAYAAWTNETAYSPDTPSCVGTAPDKTCKVTKVLFQVRSAGGSQVTDLSPAIIAATDQIHSINGLGYYNYSIGAPVGQERSLPSTIDINGAEIRATVTVELNATSSVVLEGPWTRIAATATTENFVVSKPAVNGSYAFNPSVGANLRKVVFNVSYDEGGLTAQPNISYRVIRQATDQPIRFNSTALHDSSSHVSYVSTPTGRVPPTTTTRYYYNWTNSDDVVLPEGAYTLHANISSASGVTSFNRTFFVEHDRPTARLNDTTGNAAIDNPEIYAGLYVRSSFKVSYLIDHGLARINPASLKLTLDNATQFYLPSTTWSYALTSLTPVNATASAANFTVSLPNGIIDGALHTLRLNITTEAYHVCKCDQDRMANGTFVKTLAFDGAPAFGAATNVSTAETGRLRDTELVVWGFAQDNGSGVQEVQVRIYNVSGNSTYNYYGNNFTAGTQDLWLTSERRPTAPGGDLQFNRPVWIDRSDGRSPGAPEAVRWQINTTTRPITGVNNESLGTLPAMPLDRASTYRIDVRVVDNVTRVSAINPTRITFDSTPPVIQANSFFGPSPNVTDWQVSVPARDVFRLNVSDNNCVARVSLIGRSPSQAIVGPESFSVPSGAHCHVNTAAQLNTWVFDLAAHPNFTSEIGNYEVWAEVADPAGNVVNISPKTFNYSVRDTLKAIVRGITFDPNPAPAGTASRVHIDVFENHELSRVEVEILASDGTVLQSTTLPSLPGNGTGDYTVETGSGTGSTPGLDVTLETGTYTVRARAIDAATGATCTATACPYVSATLTVVAEGAPQILLDAPATNASYVSSTPTIKFRVLARALEAANVTVLAGTDASALAVVNATFTPLSGGATVGGLNGAYTRSGLVAGDNLTVRVVATKSGITTTAEWTFRVDATPPEVTFVVTGEAEIDGKNYTTTATKVFINSTDDVGLTTTTYTTSNGVTTSAPLTYTSPITPAPATTDTLWKLEYTVSDAAGNAVRGNLTLNVDRVGPVVTVAKHGDDLVFTAVDAGVGIQGNVTVFYSYSNTGAYESVDGTSFTGNSYEAHLPGNSSATGLRYYFVARDRLGNTGGFANHTALSPYVIPKDNATGGVNVPPIVRITSPAPGAVLREAVDIAWTAEDADGDALTITIATRQPREEVLAAGITDATTYRHVINGSDSGVWTIVVTASDGVNSASATVTFTVPAGDTIRVVNNPPVTVQLGQQVPFSVAIISPGKTVAQANFRIVDSTGKVITAGQLTQSRAGVYGGATQMTRPGDFRVLVDVIYADGSQETPKDLGAFNVPVPAALKGEMWPISAQLIVLLGPVTMLLAAVGAFWRWRK